jgi:hypothetical protein
MSVMSGTCYLENCRNIFRVTCYLYFITPVLNTHITAEGICPYNVTICFKIGTVVGLVRYDFD